MSNFPTISAVRMTSTSDAAHSTITTAEARVLSHGRCRGVPRERPPAVVRVFRAAAAAGARELAVLG